MQRNWLILHHSLPLKLKAILLFLAVMMSLILHGHSEHSNFKSTEWIDITPEDSFSFYSSNEVCNILNSRSMDQCAALYPDSLEHCAVHKAGWNSKGSACAKSDSLLRRHSSTPTSQSRISLAHALLHMIRLRRSQVIIVGDSISEHHFTDSYCQLARMGFSPAFNSRESSFVVTFKPKQRIMNTTLTIEDTDAVPNIMFRYVKQENLVVADRQPAFVRMAKHISTKEVPVHSAVVIFSLGHHYFAPVEVFFQKAFMRYCNLLFKFFTNMVAMSRQQIVFYRESSAEHFMTDDGMYREYLEHYRAPVDVSNSQLGSSLANKSVHVDLIKSFYTSPLPVRKSSKSNTAKDLVPTVASQCSPVQFLQQQRDQYWREQLAQDVRLQYDSSEKFVTPLHFFNITMGRFDLHSSPQDCTHFCNSPLLWWPLWHQIANKLMSL